MFQMAFCGNRQKRGSISSSISDAKTPKSSVLSCEIVFAYSNEVTPTPRSITKYRTLSPSFMPEITHPAIPNPFPRSPDRFT